VAPRLTAFPASAYSSEFGGLAIRPTNAIAIGGLTGDIRLHARRSVCRALVLLGSLFIPLAASGHEYVATVTLVEGQSALLQGPRGMVPAMGVRLHHADIIQTGPKAFLQLEIDDGGMMELGPSTRFLTDLPARRGEDPVIGPHYLLGGWVKFTVPKRAEGPPHRINTPFFGLVISTGIAVMRVTADAGEFFIESGEGVAIEPAGRATTRVAVRAGRSYSRKSGQKGALADRPAAAFIKAMPPEFRDTLPPRLAKLKARDV
jgi:hypothetical protein